MSVLKKIMTAVRGGAREVGEFVVDANGTRIFDAVSVNDVNRSNIFSRFFSYIYNSVINLFI